MLQTSNPQLFAISRKSSREAERALFAMSLEPEKHRPETVRAVSATHAELRFLADLGLQSDLEKLKGLLAHQFPNISLAELVKYMADQTLKRIDRSRREVRPKRSVGTSEVKPGRQAIAASTQLEVWKRDGSRCTFAHKGRRCGRSNLIKADTGVLTTAQRRRHRYLVRNHHLLTRRQ